MRSYLIAVAVAVVVAESYINLVLQMQWKSHHQEQGYLQFVLVSSHSLFFLVIRLVELIDR